MHAMKTGLSAALCAAAALTLAGCGGAKNKFEKEVDNEALAVQLAREVVEGDYDLVTVHELKGLIDQGADLVIVDTMPIRTGYREAHVPGARPFPFPKQLMETWDDEQMLGNSQVIYDRFLGEDKDRPIVVYCGYTSCARSHNGALWARRLGYTNVKRFPGGIYAWKGAGYPTESGE
jgi:rhodanese-related sulfurtransferase